MKQAVNLVVNLMAFLMAALSSKYNRFDDNWPHEYEHLTPVQKLPFREKVEIARRDLMKRSDPTEDSLLRPSHVDPSDELLTPAKYQSPNEPEELVRAERSSRPSEDK